VDVKAIRLAGGAFLRNASDQQITDAMQSVTQIVRDAGISDSKAVVHASMAGGAFEAGEQANRRGAKELRASHEAAMAYEQQASSSFSEARALRGAASVVTRDGFSITGDDTYAIHRRAESAGVSRNSMNNPDVMMGIARAYFLEKYGSSAGAPLNDLNPEAQPSSLGQASAPMLTNGKIAGPQTVEGESSRLSAEVSATNLREGVPADRVPETHGLPEHFANVKRTAQRDIEVQDKGVRKTEEALRGDRAARYERKSLFNDADPGGARQRERPVTKQQDFYTGEEAP